MSFNNISEILSESFSLIYPGTLNISQNDDSNGLKQDFEQVGNDLRKAINEVESEQKRQ